MLLSPAIDLTGLVSVSVLVSWFLVSVSHIIFGLGLGLDLGLALSGLGLGLGLTMFWSH